MAVRTVNSISIFRTASNPPPIATFYRRRIHRLTPRLFRHHYGILRFSISSSKPTLLSNRGGHRSYSVQSFVESVMEELENLRRSRRVRASNKFLLTTSVLEEEKVGKRALQKGLLLEFKKDSERVLLAVAQKPDGKKNWMVSDQNGVTTSIKPQQITYVVPGVDNFDHTEISKFVQNAENNLDPTLLEFAWEELLQTNKSVTTEELAEMIFGSAEPLESYCAHLLLSRDEIYFTVLESKGLFSVYGPRPAVQVFLLCLNVPMHVRYLRLEIKAREWKYSLF